MDSSLPSAAPKCPSHPDRLAATTCSRCGTFLCSQCVVARPERLCAACLARKLSDLPASRPYSFRGALQTGWTLLRARFGLYLALTGVFALPEALVRLWVPGLQALLGFLCSTTLGLVGVLACLSCAAEAGLGRRIDWWTALRAALRAWPRAFLARLGAAVQVALFFLLLIVPGFIRWVQLCVVTPVALLEHSGSALRRSAELTAGWGWSLLGLLCAANVLLLLLVGSTALLVGEVAELAPPLLGPAVLLQTWLANVGALCVEMLMLGAYFGLKSSTERAEELLFEQDPASR
ncbi:MAG: hypothetical protein HY901_18455 [Deltaproteobacteria bacterium]|nr:hypothetical protein [Deltaproteobacteria bacterium]